MCTAFVIHPLEILYYIHRKEEHKSTLVDLESENVPDEAIPQEVPFSAQELLPESLDHLFPELLTACKGGQTTTAQLLIDKGVDVNQEQVSDYKADSYSDTVYDSTFATPRTKSPNHKSSLF